MVPCRKVTFIQGQDEKGQGQRSKIVSETNETTYIKFGTMVICGNVLQINMMR